MGNKKELANLFWDSSNSDYVMIIFLPSPGTLHSSSVWHQSATEKKPQVRCILGVLISHYSSWKYLSHNRSSGLTCCFLLCDYLPLRACGRAIQPLSGIEKLTVSTCTPLSHSQSVMGLNHNKPLQTPLYQNQHFFTLSELKRGYTTTP